MVFAVNESFHRSRANHAVLYVKDLAASVDFYTDALGLEVRMHMPGRAAFLRAPGSANDHDLGLFEVAHGQLPRGAYIGMYHLALEVGTLADLAETRARLVRRGALVGASDHKVSKSLYAKDPSGIEFEVLWRVPPEDWDAEMARDGGYTVALDWDRTLSRWDPRQQTGASGCTNTTALRRLSSSITGSKAPSPSHLSR